MSHQTTFAISAAGMELERTRVEVAALNLANAHTTQAAGQAGYTPMRVVAQAASSDTFAALMESDNPVAAQLPAVRVEPAQVPPRKVHEPGHPQADAQGFVTYPGVDTATEMVTMMSATRAYEANVAAMNMARTMALKALDIGGAS
ncbi:flagellar basal body rod protein FlgC [Caenimonas koreensis]|uniref:Flagellar basal-body rod protein FlgC n=1 Tax=Caenimonas koreensis DSM 17982 TaxID=1121255 RepID=A0A844B1T3_9BURK|nr:flagellar basal body rod protein FlgC [Caenimonas koreensis]MRD48688.1 flagellar basal body rod protein FlgC [Caenimonas koreensis DSM 17982]